MRRCRVTWTAFCALIPGRPGTTAERAEFLGHCLRRGECQVHIASGAVSRLRDRQASAHFFGRDFIEVVVVDPALPPLRNRPGSAPARARAPRAPRRFSLPRTPPTRPCGRYCAAKAGHSAVNSTDLTTAILSWSSTAPARGRQARCQRPRKPSRAEGLTLAHRKGPGHLGALSRRRTRILPRRARSRSSMLTNPAPGPRRLASEPLAIVAERRRRALPRPPRPARRAGPGPRRACRRSGWLPGSRSRPLPRSPPGSGRVGRREP